MLAPHEENFRLRWHAVRPYLGPRAWIVQKLHLHLHYIIATKGNGRERRFSARRDAEAFAKKLNSRFV